MRYVNVCVSEKMRERPKRVKERVGKPGEESWKNPPHTRRDWIDPSKSQAKQLLGGGLLPADN